MVFELDKWLLSLQKIGGRYLVLAGFSFLIFYILFPDYFKKIRIQKIFPKPFHYYRDFLFSVLSILIFASFAYINFAVLKQANHVYYGTIKEYGILFFVSSFIWMFFLHDTYFYWIHRFMHVPKLFKYIHLVHHKSTNPSPWTAYAFHPLEAILEAGIIFVIAFSLPVHRYAFMSFMLFQIIYNVYGHLGYELYPKGFHKTAIGKWINTGTAHNQHHKLFTGNYGLYTLIWDRWMGTLRKDYDKTYETVRP